MHKAKRFSKYLRSAIESCIAHRRCLGHNIVYAMFDGSRDIVLGEHFNRVTALDFDEKGNLVLTRTSIPTSIKQDVTITRWELKRTWRAL